MNKRIDPELTVACPECRAPKGSPCISRHAVRIHQARRSALRDLERQADQILRRSKGGRL